MSENSQWVVRSYSKITGELISESINLESYQEAVKLRDEWASNPDFSIGMTAKVESIVGSDLLKLVERQMKALSILLEKQYDESTRVAKNEGRLLDLLVRLERLEKDVEQIKQS